MNRYKFIKSVKLMSMPINWLPERTKNGYVSVPSSVILADTNNTRLHKQTQGLS